MSAGVELQLNEVSCTKAVDGNAFPRGLQEYPFSIGRPSAWIPSQSFFRFKLTLAKYAGGLPTTPSYLTDQVAFAENVCSTLYTNASFRAGGQDVSSIMSYIPQAAQAKMRLNKSLGWQKSVGNGCYMVDADFKDRSEKTSSGPFNVGYNSDSYVAGIGTSATTAAVAAATGVVTFATGGPNIVAAGVVPSDILVLNGKPYAIGVVTNGTTMTLALGAGAVAADIAATTNWYILKSSADEDQGKNSIYVLWQPPIAIFDHNGPLGAGDYKFSMMPNADYIKAGIESLGAITTGTANGNFNLIVDDVKFYVATIKTSIPSSVQTLKMIECQIDSKVAQGGTTATYQFQIPPSTVALTLWLQANEAGTDTQYSPTSFRATNKSERSMSAVQITYGNVSKPNTKWSAEFNNDVNYLQQRYFDTYRECDLLNNQGGIETFRDYLNRGMMVHYSFLRDSEDRSTTCQLSVTCAALPANTRVYLASWYSRVCSITTQEGSVVEVRGLSV